MDGEQTGAPVQFFAHYRRAASLLVVFLVAVLGVVFCSPPTTYAIGNCPGTEVQGSTANTKMPDINKCYSVNVATGAATATANTPTGTATDGQASANDKTTDSSKTTDNKGTTCAIEKVGWMLCPLMESAAKISDNMFDVLANNFLRVDTRLVNDDNKGTKLAWEIARNLANIMFIIAFLVIIFSQVTSKGISNYGIKKMLPRLIIAAIAVNVSYYICQLAVDATNIFGYEIQNALSGIADQIGPSVFGSASNYTGTQVQSTGGNILTVIIVGAIAVAGVVWLILGQAIAVITLVLITLLTIIVILMLRKALIVLLIVVSPIAFVLYLLPNTEKLFSKWLRMFWQLLMVFPVVALLFGAGQLASTIILTSGAVNCTKDTSNSQTTTTQKTSNSDRTDYNGDGDGCIVLSGGRNGEGTSAKTVSWTTGLVATGIAVAPLLAVWAVLKGALSAAGAIGGWVNTNVAKGRGAARKTASSYDDRRNKRAEIAALGNGGNFATKAIYRRRARRSAIDGGLEAGVKRSREAYIADQAKNDSSLAQKMAGGHSARPEDLLRVQANAVAIEAKAASEDISNAQALLQVNTGGDMGKIAQAFEAAIDKEDHLMAKAAENMLMGMGGAGVDTFAKKIIEAEKKHGAGNLAYLQQHTAQYHGNIKEKSGDINKWMSDTSGNTLQSFSTQAGSFSGLSDDQIASQTHAALHAAFLNNAITSQDAQRILTSTSANKLGGDQRALMQSLASAPTGTTAESVARALPIDPKSDRTI